MAVREDLPQESIERVQVRLWLEKISVKVRFRCSEKGQDFKPITAFRLGLSFIQVHLFSAHTYNPSRGQQLNIIRNLRGQSPDCHEKMKIEEMR